MRTLCRLQHVTDNLILLKWSAPAPSLAVWRAAFRVLSKAAWLAHSETTHIGHARKVFRTLHSDHEYPPPIN